MSARLPEGTITRRGNGYSYQKVGGRWLTAGRATWLREKGAIPLHFVVTHLNGDHADCRIENLKLASRSEMLAVNRNFKRTDEPEITKLQFLWCGLDAEKREALT